MEDQLLLPFPKIIQLTGGMVTVAVRLGLIARAERGIPKTEMQPTSTMPTVESHHPRRPA